jgi:hypothetical protein
MGLNRRDLLKGCLSAPLLGFMPSVVIPERIFKETPKKKPTIKEMMLASLKENQDKYLPNKTKILMDTFSKTCLFDVISVQTAVGDTATAYYATVKNSRQFPPYTDDCTVISSETTNINQKIQLENMEREVFEYLRQRVQEVHEWNLHDTYGNTGNTVGTQLCGLWDKIIEVCNVIRRKTLRPENYWIIAKSEIILCMPFIFEYRMQHGGDKIDLYRFDDFPADEILIGYKGDNYMDSGLVFAPRHLEQDNSLAYGISMVDPDYYARIVITR